MTPTKWIINFLTKSESIKLKAFFQNINIRLRTVLLLTYHLKSKMTDPGRKVLSHNFKT